MDHEDSDNQRARSQCGASGAAVETVPRKQRRKFSAADKLRIIQAAENARVCGRRGAVGEFLRAEGVFNCQVSAWRKQFAAGGEAGLMKRKRGRKAKNGGESTDAFKAERRIAALEKKLRVATAVIELQRKAHILLGVALPDLIDVDEMQ
jgi:transposase-like protein